MYIQVAVDASLRLEDIDNMKVFSIIEAVPGLSIKALADIAKPAEDNHYWIDADAIVRLSAKSSDPQWLEGFWDMLKKVEAYGYSDLQARRVKAHVETG
jgi:hypothetical protein